ncbi:MAG: TatD family hydrolase [Bacteroidota bacterium]
MELTDTHCHLFLPEFDPDRADIVARAVGSGIGRMFLPHVDSSTTQALIRTCEEFPGNCFPMMGLHPTSVDGDFEKELQLVEDWLGKKRFYGLGEIGIDLYWDKTWQAQQEEAFRVQLGWASARDLPVVIHVRNSFDETISIIRKSGLTNLRGIFHCFSGNAEQAREVIEMGFLLGIGGVATFRNGGLDKVLPEINIRNLVLETDSPYLAPVPFRGKRNEPSYLLTIAIRVAELCGMSPEEISQLTTRNSQLLFGI